MRGLLNYVTLRKRNTKLINLREAWLMQLRKKMNIDCIWSYKYYEGFINSVYSLIYE